MRSFYLNGEDSVLITLKGSDRLQSSLVVFVNKVDELLVARTTRDVLGFAEKNYLVAVLK